MKNPFKALNPNASPPNKIEEGVLSQISFLKFILNMTKHFTSDMAKTGIESIDNVGMGNLPDEDNQTDKSGRNQDGSSNDD